ncbi:P-loop NTPase fold protein [Bacillus safensis]
MGEGKSSFLELIKIELEKINLSIREDKIVKDKYNKTHVVRFDASEYNDQNKIWFSLLSQIFAKYEKEGGILAKLKFSFGMVKRSFKDNLLKYVINFILLGLFIVWILTYSKDKSLVEVVTKNPLYANIFGLVSTMAVTFNIVKPMFKKIKSLTKPMSAKIISQFKYPKYRELLGTREKVKESLEVLIDVWTKKNNDKIVIMVDELDRCSEKTIVEFFEALQLFLPIKSIVHVISINEEAVCFALANNNKHFFEEEIVSNSKKLSFGKKYLEKYITIPYHLPYKINYKDYIKHLLVNESDNTDLDVFNVKEKSLLTKFIIEREKQKHITPREIKKIINLLLLSKERLINIYKAKEIDTPLKFEEYISWFLFKYFYPEIAEKIIDYLVRVYKYNKYKTFDMIESQLSVSLKEMVDFEKSKLLLKYLKGIRIDYIITSNHISEHLILKKGI